MRPPPITPFYTYTLGSSLYIPLTCRCNSLTLPETRGPNFVLPRNVVASLLRVREMELKNCLDDDEGDVKDEVHEKKNFWEVPTLNSLAAAEGSLKLPSLLDENKVKEYPRFRAEEEDDYGNDTVHPRVSDLLAEIRNQMNDKNNSPGSGGEKPIFKSVVFAGEGEPTLRFHDLLSLSEQLSSSSWFPESTPIRLTTNGLIPFEMSHQDDKNPAQLFQSHGVSHVSVALMSADPLQYDRLMQPLVKKDAHAQVCKFIEQAVNTNGLQVEVTAVDRPDVDKAQLESLVRSLYVSDPVRWRPYFA